MKAIRIAALALLATLSTAGSFAAVSSADPLAAIDLNRNAIIADIVQGFDGDRAALAKRLAGLRADRLLSASLASTSESLESILVQAEKSRDASLSRAGAKALGSPNSDLVYTPMTPCRLIDTRGSGAPIAGGPFAPDERRSYAPNGACSLPTSGVATVMISFTTQNLTPASGGYLAILAPAAPVNTTVDVFNFGSEWSASNTAVASGSAAQFDIFVSTANPHVIVDVLGYFAPPQGGVVTSITAGAGLTGGTITSTGTINIATPYQLPQSCANGQLPQSNGAGAWSCAAPPTGSGGTVTAVTASAPLASSGGTTPDISIVGAVEVANGGTGRFNLTENGVLYGQGTAPVATAVGVDGQVLVGTSTAPAWTDSPFIGGIVNLTNSSPTMGNIFKNGARFIHNFGNGNTFVGQSAGNFTMTGGSNTGFGVNSLSANTSGFGNAATGSNALANNANGLFNTANGTNALFNNTSGNFHTATGFNALFANTTSTGNSAYGAQALRENTTGNDNTAVGFSTLSLNTVGIRNVAIGSGALNNSIGDSNVAIGRNSGSQVTTGSFNIHISSDGLAGDANTIRIGDINQARTFITGIRGATTVNSDAIPVVIDSAGQLGTVSSSRRFKDDIADMDASTSALMKLRPVTFHYKTDRGPSARMQFGLIAEEVEQIYPGLVAHSADGQIETVMYQYLPSMLLNEYQKQQRTIERMAAEFAQLKGQMAQVVRLLEQQQRTDTRTAGLGLK